MIYLRCPNFAIEETPADSCEVVNAFIHLQNRAKSLMAE